MEPPAAQRSYKEIVTDILGYLRQGGVLTDTTPGSVIRTIVEAFARELLEAYARLGKIYDSGFIDSAEGAALDKLVALVGVERIDGSVAQSSAIFRRDPRVSGGLFLPRGTEIVVVNVAEGRRLFYATIRDELLQSGQVELSTPIVARFSALAEGAVDPSITADDLASGTVELAAPIAGIAGVKVEEPSVVRGLTESDAELRQRVRGILAAVGGGTAKALENAVLMTGRVANLRLRDASSPGEPVLSPGELEVVVEADLEDPETLLTIRNAIEAEKGPGIYVRLRGIRRSAMQIQVSLIPENTNWTSDQQTSVIRRVEEQLSALVDGLPVEGALVWNQLVAALIQVDGIEDVDSAGCSVTVDGFTYTPPLPARIEPGPLSRLMVLGSSNPFTVILQGWQYVHVHLSLEVAFDASMPEDQSAIRSTRREKLRNEIVAWFDGYLDKCNLGSRTLVLDDLAIAINGYFQLALGAEHLSLECTVVSDHAVQVLSVATLGRYALLEPEAFFKIDSRPIEIRDGDEAQ